MIGKSLLLLIVFVSGIFFMLYAAVALIQNRKFFSSAPKDVQAVIEDKPERFRGAHALGYLLLVIAVCMILGSFIYGAYDGIVHNWNFIQFFVRYLIMLDGYKIWDMIFLDWYLLTKSHFFQHYYPEVEGTQGMAETGFNRKAQLIKLLVIFPLISLALAFLSTLFR